MQSVSIVMNSGSLALETPSSLEPHRRGMLRVGRLRGERSGTPYIRRNALNGYSPWRSAEVRASSFDCPPQEPGPTIPSPLMAVCATWFCQEHRLGLSRPLRQMMRLRLREAREHPQSHTGNKLPSITQLVSGKVWV